MQAVKCLHTIENRKRSKRQRKLNLHRTERSKLKSSPRGSILLSQFFNQTTEKTELLERSQRALEKWFVER